MNFKAERTTRRIGEMSDGAVFIFVLVIYYDVMYWPYPVRVYGNVIYINLCVCLTQ